LGYGLSVNPKHGPGALARNARTRYAEHGRHRVEAPAAAAPFAVVEQRDLTVYEQMLEVA